MEQLITDYVQCLDDDRLEEWPEFFIETGLYRIVSRENVERNYRLATMFCDSKAMMKDRVVAIRNASVFSQRYLRHLVTNIRLAAREGNDYLVQSNYVVFQTLQGEETKVFNAGRYLDRVVFLDDRPKFKEKIVVYDTLQIPSVLVIPI